LCPNIRSTRYEGDEVGDDVKAVADLLASGMSHAGAARRSGVPRATLRGWIPPGIDVVLAPGATLLRGLIHSDGYRGTNRIEGGAYSYPRYMFSNRSADIRDIFVAACRRVGMRPTQCGGWQFSVARRDDVALMDTFIGPKQ
jgi:hypothetical protein